MLCFCKIWEELDTVGGVNAGAGGIGDAHRRASVLKTHGRTNFSILLPILPDLERMYNSILTIE